MRPLATRTAENWSEADFSLVADTTLEDIADSLVDQADKPEYDIDLSQGVLTIELGPSLGTYVLNTQKPNRQIWMSSPTSGPWRYGWDEEDRAWKSTRDGHILRQRMNAELKQACGMSVALQEPE